MEEDQWRDWAVPVFAADVNTSSSNCSGMAANIDSTYKGMRSAFGNWEGVKGHLIPEYFFFGG